MGGVNPYLNTPPTKLRRDLEKESDPKKKKQMQRALGAWRLTQPGPFRKTSMDTAKELTKMAREVLSRDWVQEEIIEISGNVHSGNIAAAASQLKDLQRSLNYLRGPAAAKLKKLNTALAKANQQIESAESTAIKIADGLHDWYNSDFKD
jgi:hypothetical protein